MAEARPLIVDPTEPNIVVASSELPAHPEGLIRDPAPKVIAPPDTKELRKMFDEAREGSAESRKKQQTDRDYYDGPEQLNSDVRAVLKMRGQPAIYTNRVRPAIDGILGVLEASEADPRCYPRNPSNKSAEGQESGDEDAADIASKTLRFIADKARFDETKLDCAENFLIEGSCAAIIEGDGEEITATQIRWEEFFADPRSRRHDYKDARYMGFAQWLSSDFVRERYAEAYAAMGDPMASNGIGIEATWEDRPDNLTPWVNAKEKRLLVVTLFYQKGGEWLRCVYCAAGVFEHDVTGYTDSKGRSLCPVEAASCYVDRKNNRYGRVRDMVPIQDEINARRSRLLHLANSRQLQERELGAAQVDADTARAEASKADGVIPPGWQLVPVADLASGQQLLLTESKNEIDRMGPTPAVLGRQDGANQSGRSRMVLQQAGMTELARPLGRFEDWENRCYRQMWWRAQQFWTDPMWIRVTDDVKAPDFIQINEPVMGPVQQPVADPQTGQPMVDEFGQPVMMTGIGVVEVKKRLAELDMDIMVETVPETANLQSETFAEFIEMVRSGTDPFSPQFELLVEMSPIADKGRIIERIKAFREEAGQADPEKQQMMEALQEMQGRLTELEGGHEAVKAAKTQAETGRIEVETAAAAFQLGAEAGAGYGYGAVAGRD
jgi:hypothetical protein